MNAQQDWRTLPAGAALDILIAQHKGWRVVEEPNGWVRVFEPNGSSHFNESDAWGGKMPAYYLEDVWGYSVELDEAFKLLDEIAYSLFLGNVAAGREPPVRGANSTQVACGQQARCVQRFRRS
jgi:hypothetical protein